MTTEPAPLRVDSKRRRVGLLIALLVIVTVGPFVKWMSAQPASRLALTAAIVDGETIFIDDYEAVTLPIDRLETDDGRLLSDKAPGQPVAAVPVYALARAFGADPATGYRIEDNLTLWWVTLWTAVVPLAALACLMYLRCARTYPESAMPVALAMTFGTYLLPFGTELYGHLLAALGAYGAWLLIADAPRSSRRLFLGGAIAGVAVTVEYPIALVVAVLVGYLVASGERLGAVWFLAGGIAPAVALGLYHQAAFGSPWRSSYGAKFDASGGSIPTSLPHPGHLIDIFFGWRGLIIAPVLFLALWGVAHLLRHPGLPGRADAAAAAAIFTAFVLLQASWPNPWGGAGPGPRYLVPALPFLAVPLAAVWRRRPILSVAFTGIGVALMTLALVTFNLIAEGDGYLATLGRSLDDNGVMPTVWTIGWGPAGWLAHVAVVVVVVALLRRATASPTALGS